MGKQTDELRGLALSEIELLIEDNRGKLFGLNNELAETGKCEKSHLIPTVKRQIARALTVLREKRKS